MRRNGFTDARCQRRLLDNLPEPKSGHGPAAIADKETITSFTFKNERSGGLEIVFDTLAGRNAKGDEPLLVALADDPNKGGGEIAGRERNGNQLRDSDSGGVKEKKHGIISLTLGTDDDRRGQKPGDFGHSQGLGESTANPWQINTGQRIVRTDGTRL